MVGSILAFLATGNPRPLQPPITFWTGNLFLMSNAKDYKHFAADVVGGWVIGAAVAYCSFLIFYQETYAMFDYKLKETIDEMRKAERKNGHPNGSDEALNDIVVET